MTAPLCATMRHYAAVPHGTRYHLVAAHPIPADYRVPQLLRPMGVLCYSDALAATVDARRELPAGSEVRG